MESLDFQLQRWGNYLYKDGLSVFTGNDDQKSFSDRVVDVKFGWRDGYAGFQGRVDDLRIYKVALDDAAALLAYQGSGRLIAETVDTSVLGDWTVSVFGYRLSWRFSGSETHGPHFRSSCPGDNTLMAKLSFSIKYSPSTMMSVQQLPMRMAIL